MRIRRIKPVRWFRAVGAWAGVAAAALCAPGPASAAPVLDRGFDLFDHLATTFPVEDWVMRARARYNAIEAEAPRVHPRFHIDRRIAVGGESADAWENERFWCVRPLTQREDRVAVIADPCASAEGCVSRRPALPDYFGVRTIATMGYGDEMLRRASN